MHSTTPIIDNERSPSTDYGLADRYASVRDLTETLCETLETEDYVVQSMPDCSPAKWHLAHTSWFFENFVLKSADPDYISLHPQYEFLFNSYYNSVGERHCRPKRGLISRPTVQQTYEYRKYVDDQIQTLIANADQEHLQLLEPLITLGLHHEQQHQELLVTDIKHAFFENPLRPIYRAVSVPPTVLAINARENRWQDFAESISVIGYEGTGFRFDNEGPCHRELIQAYRLSSQLVTNGEYLAFMADGGYSRPELWLSAGWNTVCEQGWKAPLYWEEKDGDWHIFTLTGTHPIATDEPVCHVSLYEADAYARWAGVRLPTESEWESAAKPLPRDGNFVESGRYHPTPLTAEEDCGGLTQVYGDVWEWTRSQYSPYPGYYPAGGALGEYNGKFMCNQFVLRGGSCATSQSHIRPTYRNFFPPDARWQFTGIRPAKEA